MSKRASIGDLPAAPKRAREDQPAALGGGASQLPSRVGTPRLTEVNRQASAQGATNSPRSNAEHNNGNRSGAAGSSNSGTSAKPGQAQNSGQSQNQAQTQSQSLDPDELNDALHSAGVDLREEENLLSSTLTAGSGAGSQTQHRAPRNNDDLFLDHKQLQNTVRKIAAESGLKLAAVDQLEGQLNDPLALLANSCEEWIAEIINIAAIYSRHRRASHNPMNVSELSDVAKTLRHIIQKDKKAEEDRQAFKTDHGIDESADGSGPGAKSKKSQQESEETQHRAANDTARMMTAGKKRFSWLSSGSAGPGRGLGGVRRQSADPARFKEIREEPGIVLRDLLAALEEKHMGVKQALIKGYSRYS